MVKRLIFFLFILFPSSTIQCNTFQKIHRKVIKVRLTHYHPVKAQCDTHPLITADGSKIDLHKLKKGQIRWCAVSRDIWKMFPKNRKKTIWIEGYGIYEVRDVTNERMRNTIDILLHPTSSKKIYKKNVEATIL